MEARKSSMTMAEKLRQEGIREGIQKGMKEGMKEIARKMLIQNKNVQEIMDFTELTKDEIEEIRRTLD